MSRAVRLANDRGREMFDPEVKQAFGLDPKAKWPAEGMPSRIVQGVTVWVLERKQPGFHIRARCKCPGCGKHMPIGRLNQHWRTVHDKPKAVA